jgi:capsular exopolysaccharide synthesis family protein
MKLTHAGLKALPIDITVDGFQETVQRVQKKVRVIRLNRDANVIVLEYRGTDPVLVRDIPNAIVANFLATRRAAQKSAARSTVAFLRAELDTVSGQLMNTEAGFGTFRSANQVVDLTAEADAQVRRLSDLEAQRNQLEADRVALKHVLDSIGSNVNDDARLFAARIVGYPTLFKNQAVSEMLHTLTAAEDRRADLLRHRTNNDPDVRAETQRIGDVIQQLRAIATTYLDGLTQEVAAIDATRSSFGRTLSTIPQRQIENTQWQRRQTLLEGVVIQLQTRLHDAQIAEAVDDPSVHVIDAAILPLAPYFPKIIVVIPAAILCGLFGALLIAWLIESKDITIHTRGQLGAASGLPVLAAVPRGRPHGWRLRRTITASSMNLFDSRGGWDPGMEAYRSLRTNIDVLRERGAQAILVTSPSQGDGKTRTATNLAMSLARQGSHVILIDADLRRGSIGQAFLLPAHPGLSELLRGDAEYEKCVCSLKLQEHMHLDIISAGSAAPDAAELLQQRTCRSLVASLRTSYDFIVIDSPPLNVVTDAAIVSPLCDGVLLVARAGATTPAALAHAIEQLHLAGGPEILGTVLNDIDISREARAYGASYRPAYAQSSTS